MADPASGRCWLFYYPSLTSLLVLLRPVDKPNFNILDPQGPVPRKFFELAYRHTLARTGKPIQIATTGPRRASMTAPRRLEAFRGSPRARELGVDAKP